MLAVSAVGSAFLISPVVADTGADSAVVATNLAYLLGDLLLIALVVGGFALTSWRPGRDWALIGAGLGLFAVADSVYLYLAAQGTFVEGTWLDAIWPAGTVLLAVAAWQGPPRSTTHRPEGWPVVAIPLPLVLALTSVVVLVYGNVADINIAALALASATVLAALLRLALSFREIRALAESRRQATTDELTGLANRRYFYERLHKQLAAANTDGSALTLLVADLDGFKEFNDTLGHQAGDLLLQQLGPRVLDALRANDTLARTGGDEFAVLLPSCDCDAAVAIVEQIRAILDEPFGGSAGGARAARHGRLALVSSRRHFEPCVRFSRTRLTDVLHRRHSGHPRQDRWGRGATTIPLRSISPRRSGDWKAKTDQP
jgi:diguanylate cyclase